MKIKPPPLLSRVALLLISFQVIKSNNDVPRNAYREVEDSEWLDWEQLVRRLEATMTQQATKKHTREGQATSIQLFLLAGPHLQSSFHSTEI